ncbi:MAG: hypothetical protein PWP56_2747 [Acetobacterium sp.]|nr:hypothetical protein [Acetobacterium sp.]
MRINFPVEETIRNRRSIRNYQNQIIDERTQEAINAFLLTLTNPFDTKIHYYNLNINSKPSSQKLGTYDVIKGAQQYIGAAIPNTSQALYALGYEFETLVLYLTHLGLGTCWLGGTFNRQAFSQAMEVSEDQLFPIISPLGPPAEGLHFKEKAIRKLIKADQRMAFGKLFFEQNFETPLSPQTANDLTFPLEMVRLGPSASNKQPWRILKNKDGCHFYEAIEPGYSKAFSYDIQKIDLGIAAAHFDYAVQDQQINGHFDQNAAPNVALPPNYEYVFSWIQN